MNLRRSYFSLFILVFILFGLASNLKAADDLVERGIQEFRSENYEEALELLTRARREYPGSSDCAFYLGMTQKEMGEGQEAIKNFKDAIQLSPSIKEAYAPLIETLYHLGELKEATDWVGKAEKENATPARISFLKGLILLKEDKCRDAVYAFKRAKEVDPSLSLEADFQIAIAYAKERRFVEAKEILTAITSIDPASDLASFATEYEKAFSKTIEGHKTWRLTPGLAYQYNDNVVLKPSSAVPGVLISGKSDSGVITTLRADYEPLLKGPWFLNGQFNFYAITYFNLKSYNLIAPTVSLTPGYSFQQGTLTLPVSYSNIWLHEKEYESVLTARPTFNFLIAPGHIGQVSAGYAKRGMFEFPVTSDENRDANLILSSIGYIHPFSRGKGALALKYEFSTDNTEGKNWRNRGNQFNLGLLVPLAERVSLTASGDIFFQNYTEGNSLFPVTINNKSFEIKRKDRTYFGSVGGIWEVLKGLKASLQYSHTTAHSNIPIYDYRQNTYTVGIEYTF